MYAVPVAIPVTVQVAVAPGVTLTVSVQVCVPLPPDALTADIVVMAAPPFAGTVHETTIDWVAALADEV